MRNLTIMIVFWSSLTGNFWMICDIFQRKRFLFILSNHHNILASDTSEVFRVCFDIRMRKTGILKRLVLNIVDQFCYPATFVDFVERMMTVSSFFDTWKIISEALGLILFAGDGLVRSGTVGGIRVVVEHSLGLVEYHTVVIELLTHAPDVLPNLTIITILTSFNNHKYSIMP